MNEWKKGSFTVESAFLIPMAVMLTALLIVFTFYAHNKVWYTAAAYEAALEMCIRDRVRLPEKRLF